MNNTDQQGVKAFRSKSVIVQAIQLTLENMQYVKDWSGGKTWSRPPMRAVTGITLHLNFNVPFGHYIFKDKEGAFHYCAPDIFEKTYEPATQSIQGMDEKEYPIEFIEWYSGESEDKIKSAYRRYQKEIEQGQP